MDRKETAERTAAYSGNEKQQKVRKLNKYYKLGLACLVLVILSRQFGLLSVIFREKTAMFAEGALCGLALLFEFIGLCSDHGISLKERKKALFKKG